jgi:haloalkane dehalogenase
VTAVFRTPEERFTRLPGFEHPPSYREVDGLRLAHVDVGEGPPVVLIHGSPAWSYVWRGVIPAVTEAGYRCIAPDNVGYGRSDKPLDPAWYSVERHVELTTALLDDLDLRDATLVVHDWGGPIGLSVALDRPDRVARMVVLDTAVDPSDLWMNKTWTGVRDFILATEELPVGELMRATVAHGLDEDVVAAYQAPFPTPESAAVIKGMMSIVPTVAGEQFFDALRADPRPMLMIWGDSDLFLTLASGQRMAARMGREIDHVIRGAGHGLQEDAGPEIGGLIANWLGRT